MGVKERREREKLEIRDKILTAAEELFAESGYSNVSMRKIADKIEYSLPVIYQHFGNKEDILLSLYQNGNGLLCERLLEVSERKYSSLIEKLRKLGHTYCDFALEHKNYYELAFLSNALREQKKLPYNDKQSKGFQAYEIIYGVVKACISDGYYKDEEADTVCQVLWTGLHGVVSLLIAHDEFPWVDQEKLISSMIDKLVPLS